MILFSLICRLYDGMPLVADTGGDVPLSEGRRTEAAAICRCLALDPRIARDSPALILTDGACVHFVLCHDDIACLALCDKSAAPTAAFTFLDEILSEFMQLYARRVQLASRPYTFISFDVCLQRTRRLYASAASVVKRMPTRMASMPPPRRVAVADFLVVSPLRRGSASQHRSPTALEGQGLLAAKSPTADMMNEFMPTVGDRGPLKEEVLALVQRQWRLAACSTCCLCIFIPLLYFFVAFLFE